MEEPSLIPDTDTLLVREMYICIYYYNYKYLNLVLFDAL